MFIYKNKEYKNVWFTSDEHYGSDRHILFSKRIDYTEDIRLAKIQRAIDNSITPVPKNIERIIKSTHYGTTFKSPVTDMCDRIVDAHNLLVGPDDLVFHVGDFGDFEYSHKLNGTHILIMGNYEYDDCKNNYDGSIPIYIETLTSKYNFIDVLDNYTFSLDDPNQNIIGHVNNEIGELYITHKPENCIWLTDINDGYRKPDITSDGRYIMNLFGHIHEKGKIKRFGLNVGVDCNHFYPVSQADVVFYLSAILHHYDENVFM